VEVTYYDFKLCYHLVNVKNSQVTLMKVLNRDGWLPVSLCFFSVKIVSFSLHGSDPIRRVPIFRIPWNQYQYAELNQLAMREFLFNLKILNWLKFRNIKVTLPVVTVKAAKSAHWIFHQLFYWIRLTKLKKCIGWINLAFVINLLVTTLH
jgi:hypothetical protein